MDQCLHGLGERQDHRTVHSALGRNHGPAEGMFGYLPQHQVKQSGCPLRFRLLHEVRGIQQSAEGDAHIIAA
ncbi:hypothetical protein D3C76_1748410 [compost metagenome]